MNLAKRRLYLDNVDFIRRLNQVGHDRRAALLHRNLSSEAERLGGDLLKIQRLGNTSSAHRHHLQEQIAKLTKHASEVLANKKG